MTFVILGWPGGGDKKKRRDICHKSSEKMPSLTSLTTSRRLLRQRWREKAAPLQSYS